MADTDLVPVEEAEFDPTPSDSYAESTLPYQEALTPRQVNRIKAFHQFMEVIKEGVQLEADGELKQVLGAHKIWKNHLWKEAGYKNLESWIDECVVAEKVRMFGRATFFLMVTAVEKGIALGLEYDEALRLGINHGALEQIEAAGAITFERVIKKKRTSYVPTVTPLGEEKLLKGLQTHTEYARNIAQMDRHDARRTVDHDLGKTEIYCSAIVPYAGDTPLFDEKTARVFAVEFTFSDPNNGNTPYQGKVLFESEAPQKVVEWALRKWREGLSVPTV